MDRSTGNTYNVSQEQVMPGTERRRFPPYPEYRDSGVEWLGKVPQAWEVWRLKHISSINDDVLPENTDPLYEINYVDIGGVDQFKGIVCIEKYSFGAAPSRARRKVKDGDVIVSTVRTYLRSIANIEVPAANLIVSTGFAVLRPGPQLNNCYAAYALRASYFIEKIVANSVGVSYPAIDASKISTIEIACPPIVEQIAIASFLNREAAKVDALIEKKEHLIELLKEKRTALITQAVTKGLDPNVPMKYSPVEWLGKIPKHWNVFRLKFVASTIMGQSPSSEAYTLDDSCMPFLQGNAEFGAIHPSPKYYCDDATKVVPTSSLLISVRAPVGALNIADRPLGIGRGLCAVVANRMYLLPEYAWHALTITRNELLNIATGSTYEAVSADEVATMMLPIPPSDEQRIIASFLDHESVKIAKLVLKTHEAIDRLKEYRTALISAAVTGKIDVRDSQSPGPSRN